MTTMQRCPRCLQHKPEGAYHPDKWGKTGHYCRECVVNYKRAWRREQGVGPRRKAAPPMVKEPRPVSRSYHATHVRIWRARGKAAAHPCANGCGRQAAHWAYDHEDPYEVTGWSNQGRDGRRVPVRYSLDLSHYTPLCRPCHTILDGSGRPTRCPNCGHRFRPGESVATGGAAPEPKPVTKWEE